VRVVMSSHTVGSAVFSSGWSLQAVQRLLPYVPRPPGTASAVRFGEGARQRVADWVQDKIDATFDARETAATNADQQCYPHPSALKTALKDVGAPLLLCCFAAAVVFAIVTTGIANTAASSNAAASAASATTSASDSAASAAAAAADTAKMKKYYEEEAHARVAATRRGS